MSKQRIPLHSWQWDQLHQAKRIAKLEKIRGLQALLAMWEEHADTDHEYILELRAKLRSAQNQYEAMKI